MSKDLFFEMREREAMAESFHIMENVYSSGKDKKLYAGKGEKVTVISDRGNAVIVESKTGEKFPMSKPETNK